MGENVIGLAAVLMLFGTPIIAILTSHQRKMAQIFQETQRNAVGNPEMQGLRQEIRELKELVHQQAITLDNIARPLPSEDRLRERVGG